MPPGRPRIFVRIRSASASPTGVCNTHRKPMNSTIMATIGIAWSSRNVQSSPGGGGVGGPCSIVTLYASRSLRVSAASAGRPEPLALAILREEPLGKIYAFRELTHLAANLLQFAQQLLPQLRETPRIGPRSALATDPLGERVSQRTEHPKTTAEHEEQDENLLSVPHGSPRRRQAVSVALLGEQPLREVHSLNSLTSVRSWCTSPVSSERSSSSSPRTSSGSAPPPGRRMRSAIALPTGEIASRNSVPPPKSKTMPRAPVMSMIGSY